MSYLWVGGAKERSTPQKGNNPPKLVIRWTILRNHIYILNPLPANIGVHINTSDITVPLMAKIVLNDRIISKYGNTDSKIIKSPPICGG